MLFALFFIACLVFIQGKNNLRAVAFLFLCTPEGGDLNTSIYGVWRSGGTGNRRTLFIQSPVSMQRCQGKLLQATMPKMYALSLRSSLPEQGEALGTTAA